MFFWVVVMWAGWLVEAAVHRCIGSVKADVCMREAMRDGGQVATLCLQQTPTHKLND